MHLERAQNKLKEFNDDYYKQSFKKWQENDKLTLRKNRIFDALLSKRIYISKKEEFEKSKYIINIKEISDNEEIKSNPELYIKTKFDIKCWFKHLFSNNIIKIKEALFIIELFIRLQIQQLPLEKRILSRNDVELINCLCDYLLHQDKQISFYACCCISNLTFFPRHIETKIYTERNLGKILTFFNSNDFSFGPELINLVTNCSTNYNQRKYFVDHGIFERLIFLINTNLDKLEPKYYISIIRLLCNITILFEEKKEYNKIQVKKWVMPFLPFVKNTTKNYYVNNPWANYEECEYFIRIINFYVSTNLEDNNCLNDILQDDFCKILIELYYKINNNNDKNNLMKVFVNFLSKDDSINQIFIDEGILGLLLNEINRLEFKNYTLLDTILMACSNLACGNLGQIEDLFAQGLVWKAIDIIEYYSKQDLNLNISKIMYNAIITITEALIGCSNHVRVEIMLYQDYEVIKLFNYTIKNILSSYNIEVLLNEIGDAIISMIHCGESELDEESLNKFKEKLIISKIDEISKNIIFSDEIKDEEIKSKFNEIVSFLKE